MTSLTSLPPPQPAASPPLFFFLFRRPLLLLSIWILCHLSFESPPPGRLLSFRMNVADFWSLVPEPSAESASSSGWEKKKKKGGESLNRPGRWCESAWHGGAVNVPEHICLGPANMRRAKVITSRTTLWFFLPRLGKERKRRFGCTSHDVKALAWSGTLCLRLVCMWNLAAEMLKWHKDD